MTYEDAKELFNSNDYQKTICHSELCDYPNIWCGDCRFIEMQCRINEALEKQIPKKPNYDSTGLSEYWYCPTCGEVVFSKIDGLTISDEYNHRHCGGCSQAIDWSDEK